ncbi:MAG: ASKHA domain-containing protein [bacterium]
MTNTINKVLVTFLPDEVAGEINVGETILTAARRAGVAIDAPCGRRGRCGKCRVRVLSGEISAPASEELSLLQPGELAAGERLACVATVLGALTVVVPESSRNMTRRKGTAALPYPITPEPWTRKICVAVPPADLAQRDFRADLTRLWTALNITEGESEYAAVTALPGALLAGDGTVTVVFAGERLLTVEAGETSAAHYGVALDIGTTTVAGYLVNLRTGAEMGTASLPNPQGIDGADVISRIEYTQRNGERVRKLQNSVIGAVNTILGTLAGEAEISVAEIYELTMVGNTCMHHLFFGIDPATLGHAPYAPVVTAPLTIRATTLGIHAHPQAQLRALPNIAGFVGADTVGVLGASQLATRSGLYCAVDIGTNAEVLIAKNGRVVACSTAAGPAFEGAKITHGMRAQAGAIDGVSITDELTIHTIDERAPLGICGSGIIDAIGELRRVGVIESSGRFTDHDELTDLPAALQARLREGGFALATAAKSGTGNEILLTQHDIREVQLVKSAIYSGILTMLEKLGHTPADLDGLYIAGAFGAYITREHAIGIGLIPNMPLEKLHFLGNAAGAGAKMALLSTHEYDKIITSTAEVGYVELAGDPAFSEHFMYSMELDVDCGE